MQELHDFEYYVLGDHLGNAFRSEVAHEHGYIAEYILPREVYLLETSLYIPTEPRKRVFKGVIAILQLRQDF